jgi:hypothetical protein
MPGEHHGAFGEDAFVRRAEKIARFFGTTQERHHDEAERLAQERVVAIKAETDKLTNLLESNTDLTRQDKELTEQVADLTKQIHDLLIKR